MKKKKKSEGGGRIRELFRRPQRIDYSLLAILMSLICFGLLMLYSTSSYSASMYYGKGTYYFGKQAFFCVLGFGVMMLFSCVRYQKLGMAKYKLLLYWGSIAAMALVWTPLGIEVNGARRWITVGIGQLQPSELAKVAVILVIPALICQKGNKIQSPAECLKIIGIAGIPALAAYKITQNLSAAIIIVGIAVVMIFVIHPKTKPFFLLAGIGMGLVVALRIYLQRFAGTDIAVGSFRLGRILVWLNPEAYADKGGYQTLQALYAISSGGFFGKGLGNSTQKMIIPEVQNDMILSVICEELGVFGVLLVLILFGLLIFRLAVIAQNAPDIYGTLVATGILAHIFIQVTLNVAVVTNLIPNTGITLPFISYGGTATVLLMLEMGVAMSISSEIKVE
ncbi:FtsW/RodA/SpoVE family cell cycle protein [Suipraeoptans intestinalis]|uniref:FtsW/RodA/SpoVE family cell cycle protein n=1 Tax=Suipraeoptans intestinalis TaxID=2606628 RepID=UPI0023F39A19|nr:putative peptidoglycan glycosyltransferase FtsW [Suipraeoptans intestinalis]MDD7769359.1 putative peptidoglycan glycosyltransferase FtsW [Suipraeoptans intestinalis]MDY3121530.1 putative peptidoglycan glycosyltransferase FtsW [Suipraeoptans intestinalis]